MPALTDTIGAIDPKTLAQQYPHLAAKLAVQTGKAAGMDMSKPGAAVKALHSNAFGTSFQDSLQETPEYRRDSRLLSRTMEPGQSPTFDPNEDPEKALTRGYTAEADAMTRTNAGRGVLFKRVLDETNRLGQLADFNETAYKRKRISEMKPTEDIDREILDLRNRALFSKAAMYDNVKNLPYGAQGRAVAAMQKVFIDQINDLQELRTARVKDAESKVQEEIDAHTDRVSASEKRLDGLSTAIEILKGQGADAKDLAALIVDHSKAQAALKKARAQGNGITDTKDVIAQALTQKYIEEHQGSPPDGPASSEIKRQAEFIAKNRKDLTSAILGKGGDFNQLKTPAHDETETVQRNGFLQWLPDWLVSPTTTRTRSIPGTDAIDAAGFGVPYSAADEAELKRKRDLAGIK